VAVAVTVAMAVAVGWRENRGEAWGGPRAESVHAACVRHLLTATCECLPPLTLTLTLTESLEGMGFASLAER
jgi:hypothetical protein